MGSGYNSTHPTRSLAVRIANQDKKRAERIAKTRAEGKAEIERRNTLLAHFAERDKVTDGRYVGYVKSLDTVRGQLIVMVVPSGEERQWSPEFINKIP